MWFDKFQVKGDYFLPERFDICGEIFNGVLKCSSVVGFKCRGLYQIYRVADRNKTNTRQQQQPRQK